jgi:hypothetical protein
VLPDELDSPSFAIERIGPGVRAVPRFLSEGSMNIVPGG